MNMFVVYILKSISNSRYYIGMTSNIDQRLRDHNSGANRSTKNKGPWELIYTEVFDTKDEAFKRERKIKSYKGGQAFKRLINNGEVA